MPGELITLVRSTSFTFSDLNPSPSTRQVPIARNIDIAKYREIYLFIRVHDIFFDSVHGSHIDVLGMADSYSTESPGTDFVGNGVISYYIWSYTTPPLLYSAVVVDPSAGSLRFVVSGTVGLTAMQPTYAQLSIELMGRW